MPNYTEFMMRHGEHGIQALVEYIERCEGIVFDVSVTLEDRWNYIMATSQQSVAAAA